MLKFLYLSLLSLFLTGSQVFACAGWVVIVDGYSSGAAYAVEARHRGYCVAHVATSTHPKPYYAASFRQADYDLLFSIPNQGFDGVRETLRRLSPLAVAPGAETGVVYGNRLAAELGLPFNGGSQIHTLIDKYLLYRLLRDNGLPYVPTMLAGKQRGRPIDIEKTRSSLEKWMKEEKLNWPIVAKPRASAGTDGFHLCDNFEDVLEALNAEIGRRDYHGNVIEELILQKFMEGPEVAHNNVIGRQGRTNVPFSKWTYGEKITQESSRIYDREFLQTSQEMLDQEMLEIDQQISRVLHLLEYQVGPIHVETIGGVISDFNARLPGVGIPILERETVKRDMVSLALDSYLDDKLFEKSVLELPPIVGRLEMVELNFPPGTDGLFLGYNISKILESPLVRRDLSCLSLKEGEAVCATRNLDTTAGSLVLFGSEEQKPELNAIHETLRHMERSGDAYLIEPRSCRVKAFL